MQVIRNRLRKIRSYDAVWHLDSTHDLVKYKFIVSGAVGGHSLRIV